MIKKVGGAYAKISFWIDVLLSIKIEDCLNVIKIGKSIQNWTRF